MNDLSNGANAPQYLPASGLDDPRFIGKKVAFKDNSEKYHCYTDSEKWAGTVLGQKVIIEEEKLTIIPQMMQNLINLKATDFRPLFEALKEVYEASPSIVDLKVIDEILLDKEALEKGGKSKASYRVPTHIDELIKNLIRAGNKATAIYEMFSKEEMDSDGQPVFDSEGRAKRIYAIGLPSITSRFVKVEKEKEEMAKKAV